MDNRAKIRCTRDARREKPYPWGFGAFPPLRRFFFASRPSLGPPSHPAPFASLTSRPTLPHLPQNRRNTSERLELMKYNPYLRRHTLHRELKK
jgi:hypothetical protein